MQPSSPDPQFDFMLKNSAPAKKGLPLPNLPKPVKIVLGAILVILLIIVVSSVLSNQGKGSSTAIISVVARGQETIRVTTLVQTQLHLQDPQTQALAATVTASLTSDGQQLKDYMAKTKTKVSPAMLASATDKSVDSQLQSASQNNNLDDAYKSYLKDSLTKYTVDLSAAYKTAGPKGKVILKSSFDSAQTLLQSNALKT